MSVHPATNVGIAAMLVGLGLWWLLVRRGPQGPETLRRLVILILAAGALVRLTFSLAAPSYVGPDEFAHYRYIQYLYEHRSFPVLSSEPGAWIQGWEYHQSPLYYLMLTPLYALAKGVLGLEDLGTLRLLRLVSIFLWAGTALLAGWLWTRIGARNSLVVSICFCTISLLPPYAYLSSMVHNENLLALLAAAVFCLLAQKQSAPRSLLVGVLLGLAMLTKVSAVLLAATIAALLLLACASRSMRPAESALHSALMLLPGLLIFAPWGLRNLELYGSLTGLACQHPFSCNELFSPANSGKVAWASIVETLVHSWKFLLTTFWSVSGPTNQLRFFPQIGAALSYVALVGLAYGLVRKRRILVEELPRDLLVYLTALGIGIAAAVGGAFGMGLIYNQAQGRFLFPFLIPIAIYLGFSVRSLNLERWLPRFHLHAAGFFLTYVLGFTAYTLAWLHRLSF